MKPFQIVVLVVFAALALVAVFVFATFSGGERDSVGAVSIWGSLPQETFDEVLNETTKGTNSYDGVRYREVGADTLLPSLIEAIASGTGPDAVLLPAAASVSEQGKLLAISYRTLPRRNFQDTYVEAGEILLSEGGVLGVPFYIDPFVTFWNRTLFSQAGVARAPRYWDELTDIAPKISRATGSGTLSQSAVALGEWENVTHAKEILVSLIRGLGNLIITENEDGSLRAVLARQTGSATAPAESALRFFTQFADPVQNVYSWNRSQAPSRSAFLAGTLGVYFGKASEAFSLRAANPNLNFDVAPYPEVRGGSRAVPAELLSLSIPRGSKNPRGALKTILLLSGASGSEQLSKVTGLPSARRDALAASPDNPYESVFHGAALNAYVFRDINPEETDALFKRMVEGVSSGKFRVTEAVDSGQRELEALLKEVQ